MVRDIRAQYRQSVLGITWAFLPSIMTAVVFTLAKGADVIKVGTTDLPYPAYVMFSTILWQTFVEALQGPMQAANLSKLVLARVLFPREALILAKVGEVLFNVAIKLILVAALFIWFQVSVSWTVILAPLSLMSLIVLGTLFGTLLAPFGVLYQDVPKGLMMVIGIWLFLTPVIYPMPTEGTFGFLVKLNPVTPLLVTTRELVVTGTISAPVQFVLVSLAASLGLLLTWVVFRLAMPFVIERVGA